MLAKYTEVSQVIISIYLIINGLEWMYLLRNQSLKILFDSTATMLKLQDRGLLNLLSTRPSLIYKSKTPSCLSALQVCTGVILIFITLIDTPIPIWLILGIAFVELIYFNVSTGFGFEGADQMATIVLFALLVVSIFPSSERIIQVFVTTQLIFAYSIAGIAKLLSRQWRSGEAIVMVLSTHSFGIGRGRRLKNNRILSQVLCFLVIIFEISWLALPINIWIVTGFILAGLVFHIINSAAMGLNLFLWSFAAAYPWAFQAIIALH
jgi:hypothetical protein